jgi:hypothetical protein
MKCIHTRQYRSGYIALPGLTQVLRRFSLQSIVSHKPTIGKETLIRPVKCTKIKIGLTADAASRDG